MKHFRATQIRALVPSITAMALLLGAALLTRALRPEKEQGPLRLVEAFAREESPVSQCRYIAELLEQGYFAEAEPLLVSLPVNPIPMNAPPGTTAFQSQSETMLRLGKAIIQASLRQGKEGRHEKALEWLRLCRAMLSYRGDNPEALEVSHRLARLADRAETQLQIG